MQTNNSKALLQDLAGYRLTIIVILFFRKLPMQVGELCEWTQLTDKTMGKHLDWLEVHGWIRRTGWGWVLVDGARQLDFLKELEAINVPAGHSSYSSDHGSENLRLLSTAPTTSESWQKLSTGQKGEGQPGRGDSLTLASENDMNLNKSGRFVKVGSEILRLSENFFSTAPTSTTDLSETIHNTVENDLTPEEREILRLHSKEIKAELVHAYLGTEPCYQKFIDEDRYTAEHILAHWLMMLFNNVNGDRAQFVINLDAGPAHPDFVKKARQMIIDGDY